MPQKREKRFDCVKYQHEAGRRIAAEMRDMTPREKVEYLKRRSEKILDQQRLRRSPTAPASD